MSGQSDQAELVIASPAGAVPLTEEFALRIVLDVARGGFSFEWIRPGSEEVAATGLLSPYQVPEFRWFALDWEFEMGGRRQTDQCNRAAPC